MIKNPAIGIDLGTSYVCVAVWQHGKVEIIPNDQGNRTTPCYVGFSETERVIGDAAKNRVIINPANTVFDVKRLIGRKFDYPKLQEDINTWPFKLINVNGKPHIEVEYKGEVKHFVPEEIISMVLTKIIEIAEAFLGMPVKDAVITVPAYFSDSQRQATINAGAIAGLNVLRLLNEPSASALAFVLNKNIGEERNILIFDLGGGTLDVSVIAVYEGYLIEVISSIGNTNLGGKDFDDRLVDFLIEQVKCDYNLDLSTNTRALRRIQMAAERAKHTLSSATEAVIEIDALYLGIDFHTKISRKCFEEICSDLFYDALKLVDKVLADANIDRYAIDDIVLVGGSTRMYKIQSLLQDYFGDKPLSLSINPDEAVACGAAIQAAILTGDTNSSIQSMHLVDITSLSLGIETAGGYMTSIIGRNMHIPCKQKLTFSTYLDNQLAITIQVFEGVEKLAKNNDLLATFHVTEIPPAFRATPKIEVTFIVDESGILYVSAEDTSTEKHQTLVIKSDAYHLEWKDLIRMVVEAEKYRVEDEKQKELITVRNKLEMYAFNLKQIMSNSRNKLCLEDRIIVERECENCIKWLDNNLLAEKDEYEEWYDQLSIIRASIMEKSYSTNDSKQVIDDSEPFIRGNVTQDLIVVKTD